jgi:hypothetical protein
MGWSGVIGFPIEGVIATKIEAATRVVMLRI